ncbi:hypothetical protein FRC02_004846 [Tulasnella sp. 418]|nr:hypothetical protein FRC02_004846 [Tulasnella sp. 418]
MALDLAGANPAPGTPVVNYHVHRGQNQKWMLESGNKGYRIKNAQTGTYLGLAANVIEKQGNSVSCNPTPAEWDVVADGSNFIIKLASNKNMVLDLAYGVGKDGNKIIIWPMHGGANQQWIIEPE